MILAIESLIGFIIFMFGSCIFSFLNVVIYRLPKKISFVKGFSACPSCEHRLYGKDMVPIFSWLFLRGRCRYCKAPVSPRYTVVEIMGGVAALLCCWRYGFNPAAASAFAFLGLLTIVAFIDLDTMEIPDELNLVIFILGVISYFTMSESPLSQILYGGILESGAGAAAALSGPGLLARVIGIFSVSVPMLVVTLIIPGGFGGGDIKLMAACGMFLGWKMNLLATLFGILTGGIYGAILLVGRKAGRKDHFAFGPFLCMGMAIALFFGKDILTWYMGFLP